MSFRHLKPHRGFVALLLIIWLARLALPAQTSNVVVRVMAANLTGNSQAYETPQIRIFQGLKPDIVAIQEFNYNLGSIRSFVDTAFGTEFSYFRENGGYQIPNGIISRYPILASGSWVDTVQGTPNRGFAWAQIDLPGTNDLYVVSVHFLTASSGERASEAASLKGLIQSNFPANAWIIVAGDLNTDSRSETAMDTLKTFLSDSPVPDDGAAPTPNANTNEPRNKPYDYVLPSFSLTNRLTNVVIASRSFPKGIVFDSRVYTPLAEVAPALVDDSSNGQHMAVLKDFLIPVSTNSPGSNAPSITTQPESQTVTVGGNVTFTVTAGGSAPLSYRWRFNETDLAGATATSHTVTNAQFTNAGGYSVVVTNSVGSVTSAVALLTVNAQPPGGILAQWNFNSAPPDGASATGTTSPSAGSGTASLVGGATASFAGGSTTDPANAGGDNSGWNSANYPAADSGNKTAGVRFDVSTVGRQNIVIRWDQRVSNTGSKYSRLQYTTNGNDFVDYPTAIAVASPTNFEPRTNSLGAVPGVNHNPNFAFRIVSEFELTATGSGANAYVAAAAGSTYGSPGTVRFDMVTVSGDAMPVSNPPPASAVLSAPAVSAGGYLFLLTGSTGSNYIVQATADLGASNWVSLRTNASPFIFMDSNAASFPQRFYRAIAPR